MLARIASWIPIAIVTTGMSVLVYGSVQQNYRQNANDPQIQIAEDVAGSLATGVLLQSVIPQNITIDIAKSLSPFAIVYNESGAPVASTAVLDGETPDLPDGVLAYVKENGESRITWEPKGGVRSAVVVKKYIAPNGLDGFVLVGRSLREVEVREAQLTQSIMAIWLATLLATLAFYVVTPHFLKKK